MRKKSNIVLLIVITVIVILTLIDCANDDNPTDSNGWKTVTDIDGNSYKIVKIGTQWWMAENLKVTHYRNGDPITHIVDDTIWERPGTAAYCEYNNEISFVATYGRLYNWYAVHDSRNIAPVGWHVPADVEWQTLIDYLGGDSTAGGKMKDTGTVYWISPNIGATNESGFSALPGGLRTIQGEYGGIGSGAYFWSSTGFDVTGGWNRVLRYADSTAYRHAFSQRDGHSIRCVRDWAAGDN